MVGNNIPVFFIQDAIKFPDLIHAVKPKPDREIPQAASAHDSAWDFFSQQPSSLHTLFWAMSGHGTVRSYRHMDGWGIHTFRFVTGDGKSKLVKFRFQTLQGKASLLWEEAQVTAGKNADFHRQDLFESIEKGMNPEWEFQAQIMDEEDQLRFGFDLLDPTKIVPEELVPFTPLGKLTLNRNPSNYFAETEQVMVSLDLEFCDLPAYEFVSSNPVTWSEELTSRTILCCRAVSSPTWTRKSTVTVAPTSSSCQSTGLVFRFTTTTVMEPVSKLSTTSLRHANIVQARCSSLSTLLPTRLTQ